MEVQSVKRAFKILEYISMNGRAGVSEIARELSLNKSTAFGLINTMVSAGYLQQVTNNGKYEISLKLYHLASNIFKRLQSKIMPDRFWKGSPRSMVKPYILLSLIQERAFTLRRSKVQSPSGSSLVSATVFLSMPQE